MVSKSLPRLGIAIVVAATWLVPSVVSANSDDVPAASCDVVDVEYAASANLKVVDTTMGAGDGVYRIGPGHIVLRFDSRGPTHSVRMLTYEMPQHFTVVSKVLFWKTTVATRAESRAAVAPNATIAEGRLDGNTVRWTGPGVGFRADGTLTCDGSMCGQFGAPAPGTTELHVGPNPIDFQPFVFDAGNRTFSMPYTLVSQSDSPKQRTFLALGGREVRRGCVSPSP
jgi:hypothetical protein